MNEYIITTIISSITGIGGFIWGIRKDKVDLVSTSFKNILLQIQVYEQIIDGLRSEIKLLTEKIDEQQKSIRHLESRIEDCVSHKTNMQTGVFLHIRLSLSILLFFLLTNNPLFLQRVFYYIYEYGKRF